MEEQRKLIDFEKARKSVMEILAGKVTTPVAVKVAIAMQDQSVDAVEVIRCKDCGYWKHMEGGYGDCTHPRFHLDGSPDPTMNMDNFCSCAEKREEA